MKGGANPSPFAALFFPDPKKVPIYCWVDSEFSSHQIAKPSLEHKTFRQLPAPQLIGSNHLTLSMHTLPEKALHFVPINAQRVLQIVSKNNFQDTNLRTE